MTFDITPIIEAVAALIAAAVYELNNSGIIPVISIQDAAGTEVTADGEEAKA